MEKKIIGVIVEWNPFHNGHVYHLKQIKRMYPNSIIIASMGGSLMQRGEISIIDKFMRADYAMQSKLIDLIVELPAKYILSSSERFAFGNIKLLNDFGVKEIVSGSEINNNNDLLKYATKIKDIKGCDIKEMRKKGTSYAKSIEKAINYKLEANDILNTCYINGIMKINPEIEFLSIKRIGKHEDERVMVKDNKKILGGTQIRNLLKDNDSSYVEFLPGYSIPSKNIMETEKFIELIKYMVKTNNSNDNEIINKARKVLNNNPEINFEVLIDTMKDKINSKAKIRREILKALFRINDDQRDYYRVLATSRDGKNHLKKMKLNNVITRFSPNQTNENTIMEIINILYPGQKEKNIKEKILIYD